MEYQQPTGPGTSTPSFPPPPPFPQSSGPPPPQPQPQPQDSSPLPLPPSSYQQYPPPPASPSYQQQEQQQQNLQQQQSFQQPTASPFVGSDIRSVKTACEISVGEYATLQKRFGAAEGGGPSYERLRAQAALAASDLRVLRGEVAVLLKAAEGRRWRRLILGGIIATIIPFIRKLFRRPSSASTTTTTTGGEVPASNDTEHAFRKSRSLIKRILHTTATGTSRLAGVAFFVLGVLYAFQSEVSLRVARTVSRRLKKLVAKVERGEENLREEDLKVLQGWRWRVLLW
ncbi:hypothetical protein F5Y16DRAFT_394491 [Xylariaceae sp. FL0255]|nr:hypothetical protein F5Y16DRAFT_394491 [Xylariaceae sp. FL0255]